MAAVDYYDQGAGVVTPSEGLAVTTTNLASQAGLAAVGTFSGMSFSASKAIAGPWGVKIIGSSSAQQNIRRFLDSAGSTVSPVSNKTFSITRGVVVPETIPASGAADMTIDTVRYDNAGAKGTTLELRLRYADATHGELRWFSTLGNTYYAFGTSGTGITTTGNGLVTAGQKIAYQVKGVVGVGTADGTFDCQLYAANTDATPQGTLSVTNANLRTFPIETHDILVSTSYPGVVVGDGYLRGELGRTTYIPLYVPTSTPVSTGVLATLDSAGGWTVPSGTIIGNLGDTDANTYAESSAAPVARDPFRAALTGGRVAVGTGIVVNFQAIQIVGVGALKVEARLYQGSTLKGTVTVGTFSSTDTVPTAVTFDGTVTATLTKDADNLAWSDLHFELSAQV